MINASPNNVPYSLIILKNLWSDRLIINVKTFTHSTVSNLTDEAKAFADAIATKLDLNSTSLPMLNVTLIWKTGKLTLGFFLNIYNLVSVFYCKPSKVLTIYTYLFD